MAVEFYREFYREFYPSPKEEEEEEEEESFFERNIDDRTEKIGKYSVRLSCGQ